MEYAINLFWDEEAAVWIATSESVKGLVLESGSLDTLIERVRLVIPELLSFNKASTERLISLCVPNHPSRMEYVSYRQPLCYCSHCVCSR